MTPVRSAAESVVRCALISVRLTSHQRFDTRAIPQHRHARHWVHTPALARWAASRTWTLQSSLFVAVAFLCLFNCVVLGFLLFLSTQNALPLSRGKAAGKCCLLVSDSTAAKLIGSSRKSESTYAWQVQRRGSLWSQLPAHSPSKNRQPKLQSSRLMCPQLLLMGQTELSSSLLALPLYDLHLQSPQLASI